MQTKFLGQGSGRAVANQTIGKREHRFTSLTCLYRRTVSPSGSARQKSSKPSKKEIPRPTLNYQHLISLNEGGKFRFRAAETSARPYSMHAQTKLMQISRSIQSHRYCILFVDTITDRLSTASKFSGALFFAPTRIIPGWSSK